MQSEMSSERDNSSHFTPHENLITQTLLDMTNKIIRKISYLKLQIETDT